MLLARSTAHRRLALALVAMFVLLVGLRIHRYSTPAWHEVIDGSEASEVLLGEPRAIRSDDWFVVLPLAFAQAAHDPPFPARNENIGLGSPMWVPLQVPVAGPLALFRPTLWGHFLGRDVGMAWAWWSSALGLFYVFFLVFMIVGHGRFELAAPAALGVWFAPFFQYWSLNYATAAAYAGLIFVAACGLLRACRKRPILLYGALLGWAAGCFLLVLYPPYQIQLGYLVALLLGAFAWEHRHLLRRRELLGARLGGVALAIGLPMAVAALLLLAAGDAISALRGTVYPVGRVETGGGLPLWRVFSHNLAFSWQVSNWRSLLNICEASSFPLFVPVVAFGLVCGARRGLARGVHVDPLCAALTAYCFLLVVYATVGAPAWLARGTGFSIVVARRAAIGMGIADAILLVRFLSLVAGDRPGPRGSAAFAFVVAAALAACALKLHGILPGTRLGLLTAAAVANGLLAWAILQRRRPALVLGAIAATSVATTLWFNPLVRGGADYLLENPLSRRILEVDHEHGGNTFWLAVDTRYAANLFRLLGVQALNGTHPVPQLELWRNFDPERRYQHVYNRYSNVTVQSSRSPRAEFSLEAMDNFVLRIRPDAPVLRKVGITHVLVQTDSPQRFDELSGLRRVDSVGTHLIYALRP